ncbi:TlpA family protein disulfide reductase [Psychromonas hadalis]|uniref:TlpA family protein disulfide reductase n=1 Tax=Psychromonas hadalis TaxID=211669 RepID=UPI0003B2ECFE|nr:hypothetical protein [Psychromonas hadalis]
MIKNSSLEQVQKSILTATACVVNLTAKWCSDCTEQAYHLPDFSHSLATKSLSFYTLAVQKDKNVYLSTEHQAFTELLGGHGFPRTVLVIEGKVIDADNVEVISAEQLNELLDKFTKQLIDL